MRIHPHLLVLTSAVCLCLAGCAGCRDGGREPQPPGPPAPSEIVDLDVGLTPQERVRWRRTTEGSDLVPVAILRALKDVSTGETFDKSLPRYGFLAADAGPDNPYGLPVGWTTDVPEFSLLKAEFVGLNCSACHTGQIEVVQDDGRRVALRIDGAPNMADIEAFAVAAEKSVEAMLADPIEALLFVWRLLTLEAPAGVQSPSLAESVASSGAELSARAPSAEAPSAEASSAVAMSDDDMRAFLEPFVDAVQNDQADDKDDEARALGAGFAQILRQGDEAPMATLTSTAVADLGAGDSLRSDVQGIFGFIARYRALLENRIQLAKFALGAIQDPATPVPGPGRDDPWGIIRNTVFFTATPLIAPTSIPHLYWADQFVWYHADGNTNSILQRNVAQALALGAYIDPATQVSSLHPRGIFELENLTAKLVAPKWPEQYFGAIDADKATRGQVLFQAHCAECHHAREGTLFPLDEIATDRNRADSFLQPIDGEDFWVAIPQKIVPLLDFAFEIAGVTPEEIAAHEVANPTWRGTGEYQARQLDGIWSTAPYLHNGSVPTLYDLLLPPAERTDGFQLGDRAYDSGRVGYVLSTGDPIFTYDASSTGGSNGGHEYGTTLSDEERWALVEYLKTL